MTGFASPIKRLHQHLTNPTPLALYASCVTEPHFCRKYFSLPVLTELVREQWRNLDTAGRLEILRDEVVFRFLVTGNRRGNREQFLRLVQEPPFADPILHRFVTDHYQHRSITDFARSEGEYLSELRAGYRELGKFQTSFGAALAWFGMLPGPRHRPNLFRVLFSNRPLWSQYRNLLQLGLSLTFSFNGDNGPHPFDADSPSRLGDAFVRSAKDAEVAAHRICGQEFSSVRHRRVTIEANYEDTSFLNGSSGYLAFLMAHLSVSEGLPLSPHVGFTGAPRELGQLDRVADLGPKLAAAVEAGMYIVFVPARDYSELSPAQQQGFGLIHVVAFDDQGHIDLIAQKLLNQLSDRQAEFTPKLETAPEPAPVSRSVTPTATTPVPREEPAVTPRQASPPAPTPTPAPAPPAPTPTPSSEAAKPVTPVVAPTVDAATGLTRLAEPQRLFQTNRLKAFQECGGFGKLKTFSRVSVFNSADDFFVTLFPETNRLYLFDSFGGLLEKKRSEVAPRGVAWRHDPPEYLIGFEDGTIGRYSGRLDGPLGKFKLPPGAIAEKLVPAARDVFACDPAGALYRIPAGGEPAPFPAPGPVSDLTYCAADDCLVASIPKALVGLRRDGAEAWRVPHTAPSAVVACSPPGDVWAALSTGRLLRLSAGDRRVLVNVPTVAQPSAVVALDAAVVVGAERGVLVLYDTRGGEIGQDNLGVRLFHLTAGEGNILVASTGRGPSVLQPHPSAMLARDHTDAGERALRVVGGWEADAERGALTPASVKPFVTALDLDRWPEVLAYQETLLRWRAAKPRPFAIAEAAIRRIDPRKADCLFTKTRPVFVDGSNISRDHWKGSKDASRRSRLATIRDMQRVLAREQNPVLFPIITVVDMTERRWADDHAGLVRLIDEGAILETPSSREADALILNLVRQHRWLDCEIVSNDKRMFEAHSEMLPEANQQWYERVRRAFVINPKTNQITFVQASR